jgi:PAS domain S-box-containing protein
MLGEIEARLHEAEVRAQREGDARRRTETELVELRERYVMAVDRAADGMWEWDVRGGRAEFSPRWRGMLGFGDLGPRSYAEWEALVHPEDRVAVTIGVQNHLQALTPCFDAEYRLRDGRGAWRWIYSRGAAIRHASRKAYRMVVMDHDIHARKQMEEALVHAAEGLSDVSGDAFFRKLILTLSEILGTRDNLVAHCLDDPPTRVRTLAYLSKGRFWEPFEYELEGTSCGAVIERKQTVYCPTGVCELWPTEKQYDRDSYIGVPMFDSDGRIIGHFACMDGGPMRQELPHLAIFKIFSVRAAAELERMLLKNRIENLEKPHRPQALDSLA